MDSRKWNTDEDQKIYQLSVHKNLIGWLIRELKKEGIDARRTTGDDPNGDILIVDREDAPRVKEIIRNAQRKFND
ncbi:MAG: hypothetical protein SVX43_02905 [Cyanobacteriota bacterium]|nr:hypothetical protein [Cyanobacteriota bacterium]